jgi:hypothetical protein
MSSHKKHVWIRVVVVSWAIGATVSALATYMLLRVARSTHLALIEQVNIQTKAALQVMRSAELTQDDKLKKMSLLMEMENDLTTKMLAAQRGMQTESQDGKLPTE